MKVYPLTVEIITKQKSKSEGFKNSIIEVVKTYFVQNNITPDTVISVFNCDEHGVLFNDVKAILVDDIPDYDKMYLDLADVNIKWYVYHLDENEPMVQSEEDYEGGELNLCTHLILPSNQLFNLWESLFYEGNVKQQLLQYAQTMIEFSDKGVDCNIVSCNRVILLHGPPGTGKTSLCKAVAQKLAIRMSNRFKAGLFVEINSHSLFSKWFSESGKLVSKMFTKIKELVSQQDILVCILIDEIESLVHARNQCVSGTEPSDAIRVVNAVLTQLDQIKHHSNVLIFATSNITEAIDLAFIDRADIKQFLGLPSVAAIYKIYHSCIKELIKAKVINPENNLDPVNAVFKHNADQISQCTGKLKQVCLRSVGLSGRSLRKIPLIAHALFLEQSQVSLDQFLTAMLQAVEKDEIDRKCFQQGGNLKFGDF